MDSSMPKFYNPYILYSSGLTECVEDPFLQLINKCNENIHRINQLCKSSKQKLNGPTKYETKYHWFKNLQKSIEQYPDKNFCCQYNWYYTGGNLDIIYHHESLILLFPAHDSELVLAELNEKNNKWKIQTNKVQTNHITDKIMYQIEAAIVNDTIITVSRSKNNCYVFRSKKSDSNFKCSLKQIFNFDWPCVSFSLNKNSCNIFASVNSKHKIEIWDIAKQRISKLTMPQSRNHDSFAQIKYINEHTLGFINRDQFCILDHRQMNDIPNKIYEAKILDHEKIYLSNLCINEINHNICYLNTLSQTLEIDIRMKKVLQKNDFHFTTVPYLSDNLQTAHKNISCVSSQMPSEKVIFTNQNEFMPKILPSLNKALDDAILQTENINNVHLIKNRINLSTTGIKLSEFNKKLCVISVNSVGDIFMHNDFENDYSKKSFIDLSKEISTRNEKLYFHEKVETKNLELLLCNKLTNFSKEKTNKYGLKSIRNKIMDNNVTDNLNFRNDWFIEKSRLQDIIEIDNTVNIEEWVNSIRLNMTENLDCTSESLEYPKIDV